MTTTGTPSRAEPDPVRSRLLGTTDRALRIVAVVGGLVALVAGALLPVAPVLMSTPEVRWPTDPAAPSSTMMLLTGYEPETIEVRLSCRVARSAAAAPGGLVLATMAPTAPELAERGLEIRYQGAELTVRSSGDELYAGPLPTGSCGITVAGDEEAMTVALDGQPLSVTPARMPAQNPDVLPGSTPSPDLHTPRPEVDALHTEVTPPADATPADLSVRMTLNDEFDTTPTPLKWGLLWAIGLGLAVSAVAAALLAYRARAHGPRGPDRPSWRDRRRRLLLRIPRPQVSDVVVIVVLVAWTVLAPMTDDDGYYSAMAANVPYSGYVPNYYQLYNQGFTPFSWIYYALSWWQTTFGTAPVVLRVPSLLLGVLTWVLIRSFVARAGFATASLAGRLPWGPIAVRCVLAAAFLSWWTAYNAGVRPEPVNAALIAATLVAVTEGLERRRLDLLAVAVACGSLGAVVAPTGIANLAPLLVALPATWRLFRELSGSWLEVAGRWAVVLAPGSIGLTAGFADGSWRDFVRSQEIFAPIQQARTWYEEFERYAQLTETFTHFGAYARRTAVLVCLLALVGFLLLALAARVRDLAVPRRLMVAGWTTLLAFALLLPTPSNPTHHFGALAGLGAAFLALMLVCGPDIVRDLTRGQRTPTPAFVAAGVTTALVLALSWHGRNLWPYSWGLGMPTYGEFPSLGGVALDHPLLWIGVVALAAAAIALVTRARGRGWRPFAPVLAIPVAITLSLVLGIGYTLHITVDAAQRTQATWSPQSDAWLDPFATRCGAAQRFDVLDPRTTLPLAPLPIAPLPIAPPGPFPPVPGAPFPPAPLPPAPSAAPLDRPGDAAGTPAFVPGAWLPTSAPPPLPPGVGAQGSFLVPADGADADSRTGRTTGEWFALPADTGSVAPVVAVSGRLGDGVGLRAEYARSGPGGPEPLGGGLVGLPRDSAEWEWIPLLGPTGPPPEADLIRLVGIDESTGTGGWLAFSDPVVRPWAPLTTFLPAGGPVVVDWTLKFLFPCQRQPIQQHGITEPPAAIVADGPDPLTSLSGWTFDPNRGGLAGHAVRTGEATALTVRFRGGPGPDDEVETVQVFDVQMPYGVGGFEHVQGRREVSGLG